MIQSIDTCRMPTANGRHLDNLPLQKLHTIIFSEDASLHHLMVLIHCE
jgi:hypothetical protein